MPLDSFEQKVADKSLRVTVVGLGTIGLPLATFAACRGYKVIGLDADAARVDAVNRRDVPFEYADILADLPRDALHATLDPRAAAACDLMIACVPTPVDDRGFIKLDHLASVASAIGPHLAEGTLVVLESSVELGTTRWFRERVLESRKARDGLHFAYCPERYNPGLPSETHAQVIYGRKVRLASHLSYHQVPRVVGGLDPRATAAATAFYRAILEATVDQVSSPEVAEAAKLLENIFRDVNIALANEFVVALDTLKVDTYEVIRAAATKPFAFMAHTPGLVGGECIPVDTWYLIRQAERAGAQVPLMRAARVVNDGVGPRLVDDLDELLESRGTPLSTAKVAILGTAYKAHVPDDRVSQSRFMAAALQARGAKVSMCDPIVQRHNKRPRDKLVSLEECLSGADAVVLATDHQEFKDIRPEALATLMPGRIVVDARNAWSRPDLAKAGFHVRTWGRA